MCFILFYCLFYSFFLFSNILTYLLILLSHETPTLLQVSLQFIFLIKYFLPIYLFIILYLLIVSHFLLVLMIFIYFY